MSIIADLCAHGFPLLQHTAEHKKSKSQPIIVSAACVAQFNPYTAATAQYFGQCSASPPPCEEMVFEQTIRSNIKNGITWRPEVLDFLCFLRSQTK